MGPHLDVEGGTAGVLFEAYVERVLAPSLSPGQVVVMDKVSARKGDRVREFVRGAGCEVLFTGPLAGLLVDWGAFSKLKARLRREKARTMPQALVEAIGRALDVVSEHGARGRFVHCGYVTR